MVRHDVDLSYKNRIAQSNPHKTPSAQIHPDQPSLRQKIRHLPAVVSGKAADMKSMLHQK
jgi:hypothetical protein